MFEYPETCPKCGVSLEEGKGSRSPTWVSPYPKKKSERMKLDEIGRIWCRKCAVEYHTREPYLKAMVAGFTIENWHFNPGEYSKEDLVHAREVSYYLWREYYGYDRFSVTRNFFMEIFGRSFKNCKKQGKEIRFSDILETEKKERHLCKWDWLS